LLIRGLKRVELEAMCSEPNPQVSRLLKRRRLLRKKSCLRLARFI